MVERIINTILTFQSVLKMAFITVASLNKIIFFSNIQDLDLAGEIYRIPIYFFSKYEKNSLLAIQELLKDPGNYFTKIYKPYKPSDSLKYVYEGEKPRYHKKSGCSKLQADYKNFEIPYEITKQGPEVIKEFRQWFKSVKYLIDEPEKFAVRLLGRWKIATNPRAIIKENSGLIQMENLTLDEMEKKIDGLIKEAGRYYFNSNKNKVILRRFSKYANIAYKNDDIYNNDTGYSDEEVKSLLKDYDIKFKKPLKHLLVQYYRIKLNPEIKMEGYLLEDLGFKPCAHCHAADYQPGETSHNDLNEDINNQPADNIDDYLNDDADYHQTDC